MPSEDLPRECHGIEERVVQSWQLCKLEQHDTPYNLANEQVE